MKAISEKTKLAIEITFLRSKQIEDFWILKEQYHSTIDSYKPFNLIKSATREFISNPNLKSNIIKGAIGLGTNYISKNIVNENSVNSVKRTLGRVIQFAFKKFIEKK